MTRGIGKSVWAIYKKKFEPLGKINGPLKKKKKLTNDVIVILDCNCFILFTGIQARLKCTVTE